MTTLIVCHRLFCFFRLVRDTDDGKPRSSVPVTLKKRKGKRFLRVLIEEKPFASRPPKLNKAGDKWLYYQRKLEIALEISQNGAELLVSYVIS